jgi:hypothetical protein
MVSWVMRVEQEEEQKMQELHVLLDGNTNWNN